MLNKYLKFIEGKVKIAITVTIHQGIVVKTIKVVEGEAGQNHGSAFQKMLCRKNNIEVEKCGKFQFFIFMHKF